MSAGFRRKVSAQGFPVRARLAWRVRWLA